MNKENFNKLVDSLKEGSELLKGNIENQRVTVYMTNRDFLETLTNEQLESIRGELPELGFAAWLGESYNPEGPHSPEIARIKEFLKL